MHIVLVGAGHAHLHLIHRVRDLRRAGIDLTLISPDHFIYSGLATAVLSGALPPGAGTIDVGRLARAKGVRHLADHAAEIDLACGQVLLEGKAPVAFDALSLNTGSRIAPDEDLARPEGVWPAKPLEGLLSLRPMIEAAARTKGQCPALVIAGGGQTAHEIAAALCGLCERLGIPPDISLVRPQTDLDWAAGEAGRRLDFRLQRRGLRLHPGRVVARRPGICELASGAVLPCEALILATGLGGAQVRTDPGLATDAAGRWVTSATLQSISDPRIFAVGDCGVIADEVRPCAGVFGVRAAPFLLRNLIALARGRPMAGYRPQKEWLSVMDLGDGTGFAQRGRAWWLGPSALALKRYLDLGFMRRMGRSPDDHNSGRPGP